MVVVLRAFVAFILFCRDTINEFLDKNCPHVAAAISFYALLAFFPLVLAAISILGFVLGPSVDATQIAKEVGKLVPVSEEAVTTSIEQVVQARGVTGIVAAFGLLWTGSAVFGAIRKGINTAWGIRQPRSFLHERLIDLSLALGAGLLFLISASFTAVINFFEEIVALLSPESTLKLAFVWGQVAALAPALLSLLAFLLLYWLLPNTRVRLRHVWPGAVAATVAFQTVTNVFVLYVGRYSTYNVIYGPLGTVVAIMIWVYFSAIILLFCALLAAKHSAYMTKRERSQLWSSKLSTSAAPTERALAP